MKREKMKLIKKQKKYSDVLYEWLSNKKTLLKNLVI